MSESGTLLVADTSAVINLHATGCAEQLIDALPYRFVVVDIVAAELASGRCRGHPNADLLQSLVEQRLVEVTTLDDAASLHFEELVIGPAAETLDDGEAATIAYAVVRNGMVILDERKGIRICSRRFPDLRIACSVDLFSHSAAREVLGAAALAEALFNALREGRMRVPSEHIEWVIGMIGTHRAALCSSLSSAVRQKSASAK